MAQYKLHLVGPGDEYLGTIELDGLDLTKEQGAGQYLADAVSANLGTKHATACAALAHTITEN